MLYCFILKIDKRQKRIRERDSIKDNNKFSNNKIIVSLKKECTYPYQTFCRRDELKKLVDAKKVEVLYRPKKLLESDDVGVILSIQLKNDSDEAVMNAIEALNKNPCVKTAEPDYYFEAHLIPNDRYLRYLWGLEDIYSPLAWNLSQGERTVVVGVLDSGVDFFHADLTSNLIAALDAQADVDRNIERFESSALDETGHGTHVAGTIGATGNNFIGVTGVCWRVSLVSLKLGSSFFSLSSAIKAIDYAAKTEIPILNNSWGTAVYSDALNYAISHYEGLFVASAGNSASNNDFSPIYPASYNLDNIISVAATNRDGTLAGFSNYGLSSVDIAAPGADILSTDLSNTYSLLSGTSMAAPHVSGAAALIKGYKNELSTQQLKQIILSSVQKNQSLQGRVASGGVLNVWEMMRLAETFR